MKLFFVFFIILAYGCSVQIKTKNLPGAYCLNMSCSYDSIIVQANGKYIHRFITDTEHIYECTGKWKFNERSGKMLFEDFVFFTSAGPSDLPPGIWFSQVEATSSGQIRLIYSSENDIYFQKQLLTKSAQ